MDGSALGRLARAALPIIALVSFALGLAATLAVAGDTLGFDFLAYHQAAARLLAGQPLYDMSYTQTGGFGLFYYPPTFAPILLPLGLLTATTATWSWIAISIATEVADPIARLASICQISGCARKRKNSAIISSAARSPARSVHSAVAPRPSEIITTRVYSRRSDAPKYKAPMMSLCAVRSAATLWMIRETVSAAPAQNKTFQLKIVVRSNRLSS